MDFVRRAIRAIGQCAIKIDSAAERCVNALLDLIRTRVSYVVQEAVVVIKVSKGIVSIRNTESDFCCIQDIFRKYPNQYEGIIPTLCASLEELDEPEAKASLIWILGEYAEKIDNSDELLTSFLETFADESAQVYHFHSFSLVLQGDCRVTLVSAGSTPNPHGDRETLLKKARLFAGSDATGAVPCDKKV